MIKRVLADEFSFSSPSDDHIDRATYFERCWPNSERIRLHHIRTIAQSGNEAFVLYDAELTSGNTVRNAERFVFDGDKVKEIEVFFGEPTGGASKEAARQSAISAAERQAAAEAEIRGLIGTRINAIRTKHVDGATSNVAHAVVLFDVVDAFLQVGIEAMRERASSWFSSFEDTIGVEIRDLTVSVSGDTAFAHSLNRYFGKLKSGGTLNMCVRVTLCLRKINGRWMITYEHNSVPFDSKSGTASISPNAQRRVVCEKRSKTKFGPHGLPDPVS